jgi:Ni/Co efflux regulator RcnB
MRRLLLSTAILALLAAPALAQHDHGHHGGGRQGPPGGQPAPHAAPAAPQAMHGGNRGGFDRGGHGPATRAAPQATPAAPATAPPRALARPQASRGNVRHDNDRRDNNRRDFRGSNGSRPGFANPGNTNRGFNRGTGRRDYSGFRNYHQNFRSHRRFHAGSYHRPRGWYYRRWSFGQILPALFWARQYWLNDYIAYDLPPPPYGTVWVRYGNDALLIDRDTGEIITVEYDVFY